jgi:hypothetical protein
MFREMSILRKLGKEYHKPVWCFIQVGDPLVRQTSIETPFPTEAQTIWNINVQLAYGVKGISYYTIFQPASYTIYNGEKYDFTRDAFFGPPGNINQWYYYVQKENKQISAADHILMNSANMGVIPVGPVAKRLVQSNEKLSAFRELTGCSADEAIIGCFDYFGKTVLYVVNNSSVNKQKITLNFDNNYGYEVIQRGISVNTTGKSIMLTMEAGEGTLVRIK